LKIFKDFLVGAEFLVAAVSGGELPPEPEGAPGRAILVTQVGAPLFYFFVEDHFNNKKQK
jgi:hypothetical protein